ncbi:cytochrome P450 3A24-like [Crassostrea virginica]|uniref:Cytochrome P450 3A24-like n=1 Tax=Crassostrea virginica TaxID=6565 RepID=A0A8B8ETF3_CRAVI|nr:cytochrome P450 3A24-like [Crassostrea virginica]
MITHVLLVVLVICLIYFYRQRKEKMEIFEKMGIPGPKPNFLFGNLLSFWRMPLFKKYQEWYREYGKTFGYFEGPTPVLVTADVDVLQQVFVKQFKKFHARKVFPVQVDPDSDENVHMFFARGERWRRLRSIVNPAFSSTKMRTMTPLINHRIDQLLDIVEDHNVKGTSFDSYELFQRLTLDTIADCGFGMDTNALINKNDECIKHCRGVIRDTTKRPILFMLGFMFPALHRFWIFIYNVMRFISFNPVFWLEDSMRKIVRKQKQQKPSKSNLLELMVTSEFNPESDEIDVGDVDQRDNVVKRRLLTTEELVAQCLLFLLAGYETTSTTLAYIMYEMSVNPEAQKKLQEEIDEHFPENADNPSYDQIQKMEYLDMVWCETLRKYPLASTVVARQCMESCTVNGIEIPKGMLVQANVWSVHYNQDHWIEETQKFIPERFTEQRKSERHPLAWMPFGSGPRTCVGLRLAQLEGKMTIIRMLKKFSFVPSATQEIPIQCVEGATILPKDGVNVQAVLRSS